MSCRRTRISLSNLTLRDRTKDTVRSETTVHTRTRVRCQYCNTSRLTLVQDRAKKIEIITDKQQHIGTGTTIQVQRTTSYCTVLYRYDDRFHISNREN